MEISVEQMTEMLKSGVIGAQDRGNEGILVETNTGYVFFPAGKLTGKVNSSLIGDSHADTKKIEKPTFREAFLSDPDLPNFSH